MQYICPVNVWQSCIRYRNAPFRYSRKPAKSRNGLLFDMEVREKGEESTEK